MSLVIDSWECRENFGDRYAAFGGTRVKVSEDGLVASAEDGWFLATIPPRVLRWLVEALPPQPQPSERVDDAADGEGRRLK